MSERTYRLIEIGLWCTKEEEYRLRDQIVEFIHPEELLIDHKPTPFPG